MYYFKNSSSTPEWSVSGGHHVAMSSDGRYIAAGYSLSELRFFENSDNIQEWSYSIGASNYIQAVDISDDGFYIAMGTDNNKVYALNRTDNKPMWTQTVDSSVQSISISGDGQYIAVGTYLSLYMFNTTNTANPFMWSYATWGSHSINSIDITAKGELTAAGGSYGKVYLFNTTESTPLWIKQTTTNYEIESVKITPDGKYITAGGEDDRVYLFENSTNVPLWSYSLGDNVRTVTISADGKYIPAGGRGSELFLLYGAYPPNSFQMTTDANNPDIDGIFYLNWTSSLGADTYSLYVNDKYITEINDTITRLDTGLTNLSYQIPNAKNGKYYYKLLAINSYGNISSNCIYIQVKRPPSSFSLNSDAFTQDTDGNYNLTWTESFEANNYSVYTSTSFINTIGDAVLIQEGITELNYYIIGKISDEYYYMVVAFNEYGNTTSNCHSVDVKIPPNPFGLTADSGSLVYSGDFNLTWTKSNGADNYSVFKSDSFISEIDGTQTLIQQDIIDLNWSISTYKGIWYYVTVAYNATGNTSSNCVLVDVRIPPGPFSLNSDADPVDTDGSYTLQWNISLGYDNYSVYVSDKLITIIDIDCSEIFSGFTGQTYLITNRPTGEYYYVVIAFNKYGNTSTNNIHITVHRLPSTFTLTSEAKTPDPKGAFYLNWTSSTDADNYSIYMYHNFISEINDTLDLLSHGLTNLSCWISGLSNGEKYFIVVANNTVGQTPSNCIIVEVSNPPSIASGSGGGGGGGSGDKELAIPFGNFFLLFSVITIIVLVLVKKRCLIVRKIKY